MRPEGGFWSVADADGDLPTIVKRGRGLPLQPGQRLAVVQDPALLPLRTISVQAVRPGEPAGLELSLPLDDGSRLLARVWPDEPYRVQILQRDEQGGLTTLASEVAEIPAPGSGWASPSHEVFTRLSEYHGFDWRLGLGGQRVQLSLAGVPLASAPLAAGVNGPPSLTPLQAPMTLLELTLQGGGEAPRVLRESFDQLGGMGGWAALRARWLVPLVLLLLGLASLRAQCLSPPGTRTLLDACLLLLAPAALVLLVNRVTPLGRWPLLAGVGLALGLAPAAAVLARVGAFLEGVTRPRPFRPVVVAGVVALACLLITAHARLTGLGPLLDAEARASAVASLAPPEPIAGVDLDAGSELMLPGPFRDFDLDARVTLEPGAILELRLRAADPDVAAGQALFLPADDVPPPDTLGSAGLRWAWEQVGLLLPVSAPGPRLAPGTAGELHVEARGRSLSAWLGDRSPILRPGRLPKDRPPTERMAALREPAGAVVLLAARGRLRIENLSLTPRPAVESSDPRPAAWRNSGLPLLAALALALAAGHLLGLAPLRALEIEALALAPLALALGMAGDSEGALPQEALGAACVAGALLASLPALLARRSRLRRLAFCAMAAVVLPGAFATATERPLPLNGRAINDLSYTDVHSLPLAADRLHLEHPLLRRWNGYLADHAFKGRRATLAPRPGTHRVVFLGGSSTFGYHLPESAHLDWPSRVGRLVHPADGGPVEALNAAWPAATGSRLLPFFEHVLLDFSPEVLVLCLGYNDAFALARPDELSWFARRLAEGTPWSTWERRVDLVRAANSKQRFVRELVAFDNNRYKSHMMTKVTRSKSHFNSHGQPTPPQAFAQLLTRFADVCAGAGVDLVLVNEPLSGERPVMWTAELAEAMARVASDRRLPLIDPAPALAQGDRSLLFMDVVHPTAAGHRVIAEQVAPVLEGVLNGRP